MFDVSYGMGFLVAIFMWMTQGALTSLFYTSGVPPIVRSIFSLIIPPWVWAKNYANLKLASERGRGVQWDMIGDNGFTCAPFCQGGLCPCDYYTDGRSPTVIMPVAEAIQWFIASFFMYSILAIYLDQVIPSGYGRSQPFYYIFLPSYWCPSTVKPTPKDLVTTVVDDESLMDEDVRVEMHRVLNGGADADAVRVVNLAKTFGGGCCKAPFTAVFRVNVGIKHETLFCLLGHNGAGKTTTFNMLSGMFAPTQGDAFVLGYSIKRQLRSVQSMMGICPQHDVLWPELSGTEHLTLFAGLARIPRAEISRRVSSFLQSVDLVEFAGRACSQYSGGMRRRLSVACSLIADPKVVYLDEPTTGMDPVNRRGVWDVIEKAKKGRVVVLTTHAMEEADTLGDVISIMSRGRLHCLGTALHLKNKYGTGYTVDIKVPIAEHGKVLESLTGGLLPNAHAVGATEISGTVDLADVAKMVPLCAHIESSGTGADMTVSMCTLETVFISIAEAAGDPEQRRLQLAGQAVGHPPAPQPQTSVELSGVQSSTINYGGNTTPTTAVRVIQIPRTPGQKLGLDLESKKGKMVVTKVYEGFAADATGLVAKKDIITHVAGESVAGKKHDAVYALIAAIQIDVITLTIDTSDRAGPPSAPASPPPSPPAAGGDAVREVQISRAPGQKLGLDMKDQKGKVVITLVHEGFAAAASGLVAEKDIITHVAGESVAGKKRADVIALISAIQGDIITLTIDTSKRAAPRAAPRAVSSTGGSSPVPVAPPTGGGAAAPNGGGAALAGAERFISDDGLDTHGVLDGTLQFKPTPFGTQFFAVARKNLLFQRRQPLLNCCCCVFMPMLFLLIYVLLMYLPALIIRGNIITCGQESTYAVQIDDTLKNVNGQEISRAVSQLRLLSRIGVNNDVAADCPTQEAVDELSRFEGYAFAKCSNLGIVQLGPEDETIFTRLRTQYECNNTFYEDIYDKYEYVRQAQSALDTCDREKPNVTFNFAGAQVTQQLECYSAFGIWAQTCTNRPSRCPRTTTTSDEDADALTEVEEIVRLSEVYGCSSDVGSLLNDYSSTPLTQGGVTVLIAANISKPHVATCMSNKYMCPSPRCRGVIAYLNMIDDSYPPCTNDTLANQMEIAAYLSTYGYDLTAAGYNALNCQEEAADFCARDTVFRECPNIAQKLRNTEFPFSVDLAGSMTAAEVASLGELRHSTDNLAGCTDCFAALLDDSVTVARGALANFTLRQNMGDEDAAMSLMNVACATGEGSAPCTATRAELDAKLIDMWYKANMSEEGEGGRFQGAYHVSRFDHTTRTYEYTALYNGTLYGTYDDETEPEIAALLHRMSSTIYKSIKGVELRITSMGYPGFDNTWILDLTLVLAFVFPAVLGFLQIMVSYQIVAEKATNMRELMVMAGLGRRPYWVITWLYGFLVYLGAIIIFLIISFAFSFKAVGNHDFIVILVLVLVYAAAMVSYSCCISTFFNNKWTCLVVGFFSHCFIFVLLGVQFAERASGYRMDGSLQQFVFNLHPTIAMAHASELLHAAGVGDFQLLHGVRFGFHNIGFGEAHPLSAIMLAMLLSSVLWMVFAVYCDVTLKIGPGIKSSPLFCVQPKTYMGRKNTATANECAKPAETGEANEVKVERERVSTQTGGVRALGLSKWYPGAHRAAVVNVQFGINESECFGLLGSNGAGKSTTIHILCGLHPPSTGTVICGEENLDIRDSLTTIQSAMGVCSQDNLLWDDLTGPEHLRFFSRIRRVDPKSIKNHIDYWLKRVNLSKAYDRRKHSRSYSGGMKRRLGVANAFIGNPKLVYLDEPSTGLDPESRQQLWRAVLAAKPGKSIILTTHALEEAEALCDRVGIMTFGLMRTLGTPTELRLRFDQGYKFMLACEPGRAEDEDGAHRYVLTLMPQARLVDAINGVRTYIVPKGSVTMSSLFEGMEAKKGEYRIKDWGLSHTSLEEVFLQIVAANALKAS